MKRLEYKRPCIRQCRVFSTLGVIQYLEFNPVKKGIDKVPKISVLLSTYNSSQYIDASVQSILEQTYQDFELIITDDGSSDNTLAILEQFKDPRIRYVIHEHNKGLIYSLNEGIELSSGEYIARMDADDIATPHRLEQQAAYLDANPQVGVLGGLMRWLHTHALIPKPVSHDGIRCWQLFHSCLGHPTVMLRANVLHQHGIRYDEQYKHAEDYEIWERLGRVTQLANLPYCIHYYRAHEGQVSLQFKAIQENSAKRVHYDQLHRLGITPTDEEYAIHMQMRHFQVPTHHTESYEKAINWVSKLIQHNHHAQVYDPQMLESVLTRCLVFSGLVPSGVYDSH